MISLQDIGLDQQLNMPIVDPHTGIKILKAIDSNESIESLNPGDEEHKKKFMMGFDEHRDKGEMICKTLAKDFKL